jgi:DNA-binding transcriptional MerR regulator
MAAESYSVSEIVREVGLSAHTLRWYEQVGLLDPVVRDTAGRRRYGEGDLARLRFLLRLRSTGMPVRDMIRYIDLARDGDHTTPERLAILVEHRERVVARIDELQEDLKVINYKIDNYSAIVSGEQ